MSTGLLTNLRSTVAALALMFVATSARAIPSWAESYGVGSYDTAGQPTADPFYGSGFDYPTGIAKMPDGGLVVAGQLDLPRLYRNLYSSHTSGTSDGALVRFASDGTILWQITLHLDAGRFSNGYFSPAPSQIQHLATDAQGNIFISGGKGNPDNGGLTPFVAKFASDGTLIWQNGLISSATTAGNPPQTSMRSVSGTTYMGLTADGGVVLSGSQSRPDSSYTVPFLAKLDGNGQVSFYHVYEQPNQYADVGPVCQSSDGSKYFTAIPYPLTTDSVGSPINGLGLAVYDASGNILAQRGWPSLDGASETMVAMIPTADGGFAVLSAKDNYGGFTVRKFNVDGSATTLERTVSPAQNSPIGLGANSLAETADGGLLVSVSTRADAGLIKIGSDGAIAFVTALGGPDNEGGPYANGPSGTYAVASADGGYGLTCTTTSYYTGLVAKPDWWIVKIDSNRKVRNFAGIQADQPLSYVTITGNPQSPVSFSYYKAASYTAAANTSRDPVFNLIDLGVYQLPDLPTLAIQASSPRIVSPVTAEAVVGQHFAYHTLTAFFPTPANVIFSASGLPQGFVIDTHSGVISGAPAAGSETAQPIVITLGASDGTDTASIALKLTIGDGAPGFTVNGSDQPAYPNPSATPVSGLADTALTFVAKEPGAVAGRVMRVEATTTPGNEASWRDLTNGTSGFMENLTKTDIHGNVTHTDTYVVTSNDYPQASAVYFRAKLKAPAKPDAISNVVGPFDLTATKLRIGATELLITHNGPASNIRFGVHEENLPSGLIVKLQTTQTPASGESWTDVPNGTLVQDTTTPAPHEFYLGFDDYPAGEGVYFRAVATIPNSNYVDSISSPQGDFLFVYDPPAVVTTTVPSNGSTDGTDYDDPITVSSGSFNVSAHAQSGRSVQRLALTYDGDTLASFTDATQGSVPYITNVAGDHVIEAVAIDDLHIAGHSTPVHVRVTPAAPGKLYFVTKAGNWNDDPPIWLAADGTQGVPGLSDFAVLSSVDVVLPQDVTVRALSLNGGTMSGAGKLTVTGFFTIGGGRIYNDVTIESGATLLLVNDQDIGLGGHVINAGRLKFYGKAGWTGIPNGSRAASVQRLSVSSNDFFGIGAFFQNLGQMLFHPPAGGRQGSHPTPTPGPSATPVPEVRTVQVAAISNSGSIKVISNDGGSLIGSDSAGIISSNSGGLIGSDSAGLVDPNGNPLVAAGGGNLLASANAIISSNSGGIISSNSGGVVATGGSALVAAGGGNLAKVNSSGSGAARESAASATSDTGFSQNGGETTLTGLGIIGPMTMSGGTLSGTGIIIGNLTNSGGYLLPSALGVTGNFDQGATGTIIINAAGGAPGQFAELEVGGSAQLGGKLDVRTTNGYLPLANDSFNPLGFGAVTGSFASISSNAQLTLSSTGAAATISPAAPNPGSGQPLNISTRMEVLKGDNILIGGFIVYDPTGANASKKVLIRALGPSLPVSGSLADPLLELHQPDGSVITNDNWQSGDTSQIPSGFAPSNTKESLLVATLAPGAYTAQVKGADGGTGIGLVEVYDLSSNSTSKLANISTRGFVNTGDNVMIGGFIVGGQDPNNPLSGEPGKVLVRGIGPSLGVPGSLSATTLELHDANGAVISNEGWRATQESDIVATTIPPTNDNDSAILATLAPGAYTAVLRGSNNTTGIGLIEAYNLQ